MSTPYWWEAKQGWYIYFVTPEGKRSRRLLAKTKPAEDPLLDDCFVGIRWLWLIARRHLLRIVFTKNLPKSRFLERVGYHVRFVTFVGWLKQSVTVEHIQARVFEGHTVTLVAILPQYTGSLSGYISVLPKGIGREFPELNQAKQED